MTSQSASQQTLLKLHQLAAGLRQPKPCRAVPTVLVPIAVPLQPAGRGDGQCVLPLALAAFVVQVCNMKPVEIMSLLEEASGTRMYEKKKEKAMATMDKKDQKLQEIEVVLRTEIRPSVSRAQGRGCWQGGVAAGWGDR